MSEESAFKNWINTDVVSLIASEIKAVAPSFNASEFSKISPQLSTLELKNRVLLITDALKVHLPQDYLKALKILVLVIKRDKLTGFTLWPLSEYIGQFGVEHFEESMKAMHLMTQKFTSEFAVRPYFLKDSKLALKFFKKFAKDPNHHVRRWASEGSRPLLPWGLRLPEFIEKPESTLEILELLKHDDELYVRKSVANHLNDISKHNPSVVLTLLSRWVKECPVEHKDKINWIKRHALRTLIKKGDPKALKLMGVSGKTEVSLSKLSLNQKTFKLNDSLVFTFKLQSKASRKQKLVIDYLIGFVKANGSVSKKAFKLKTIDLAAGDLTELKKSHSLKKITTMKYFSGTHTLSIQINGVMVQTIKWNFNIN